MRIIDLVTDKQIREKNTTRNKLHRSFCPYNFNLDTNCNCPDSVNCKDHWNSEIITRKYKLYAHMGCRCSEAEKTIELEFSECLSNHEIEAMIDEKRDEWLDEVLTVDVKEIKEEK